MPRSPRPSATPDGARARWFLAVALLLPFALLGTGEVALRLFWEGGRNPLFGPAVEGGGALRVASRTVGRRYFPTEAMPPAPPHDAFAREKPANGFRIFVLGESAAAGFPFPHNGTFSRILRDALRDVLPADSVEVVNVGIPATNSYQMLDLVDEVIAERPDAVLVYAGHNEFYGALGVGSTVRVAGSPALVRLYLRAMRWRVPALLNRGVAALRRRAAPAPANDASVASFMETVVADKDIRAGSARLHAGERQFEGNLARLLARLAGAGVPAFVGSLASNVRDLPPFAAAGNEGEAGAKAAWLEGQALLARGDTVGGRARLRAARELDVVRFRAPASFNGIIQRAVAEKKATYVPVAELFEGASPDSLPGHELLLEHVHPTRAGATLMARAFFEALQRSRFLGRSAREASLAPWSEYQARMALSPFDERVAAHTVATLRARWPFVPATRQIDYRATYRPVDAADSLALLVSRGGVPWEAAKVARVEALTAAGDYDDAIVEAQGLVRDAPFQAAPLELAGRALFAAGRDASADTALRSAWNLGPSGSAAYALGLLALRRQDPAEGVTWLERALQLEPRSAPALYQLSLAFALRGDIERARATAARLASVNPTYPPLAEWLRRLGMPPVR